MRTHGIMSRDGEGKGRGQEMGRGDGRKRGFRVRGMFVDGRSGSEVSSFLDDSGRLDDGNQGGLAVFCAHCW